jgi:predicted nucleotidyltransferase
MSDAQRPIQPLLKDLQEQLHHLLGGRMDSVILYGSQARQDAHPGSDVDVLIIIQGEFVYWEMIQATSEMVSELSLKYDVTISRTFVSKHRFESEQIPFLINVRREGIVV